MTDNQARTPMGFIGSLKITRSIAAGNAAGVVSSALTRCRAHRERHLQEQARSQAGSGRDGTNYRNSFSSNDIGIASEYAHETADVSRTIEANVAIRNGDGFYLLGAGDKLKANTTKWNHRSGIYAPNAIDLGQPGVGERDEPTMRGGRPSVSTGTGDGHDLFHPNG